MNTSPTREKTINLRTRSAADVGLVPAWRMPSRASCHPVPAPGFCFRLAVVPGRSGRRNAFDILDQLRGHTALFQSICVQCLTRRNAKALRVAVHHVAVRAREADESEVTGAGEFDRERGGRGDGREQADAKARALGDQLVARAAGHEHQAGAHVGVVTTQRAEEFVEGVVAADDDAYFWATHQGAEIDLILRRGDRLLGVECKRTDAPRMTRSIRIALDDLELEKVIVIYPGDKRYPLDEQVEAGPSRVWSEPAGLLEAARV